MYLFRDSLTVQKIKNSILVFNFGLGFSLIGLLGIGFRYPMSRMTELNPDSTQIWLHKRWKMYGNGAKRKFKKYCFSNKCRKNHDQRTGHGRKLFVMLPMK
jgi:hypothetical protein